MKWLLNLFLICYFTHEGFGVTIRNTSLGPIKGISNLLSLNGKRFDAFLGVPYAKPPVGSLRFQSPVIHTNVFNETFDATRHPPKCPQFIAFYDGDEDCLYMNIYVPANANKSSNFPVLVFSHPGRRIFGDSNINHYGPHIFMDKPIIFVSIQYRLGPLGFLSTADDAIPGNYGLKDQVAALKWIQLFISDFGGNSNNVTLFGESSSACDIHLHLVSPLAKKYFHRGISQSGHILHHRGIMTPRASRKRAWELAKYVGCNDGIIKRSEELLDCMRSIPAMVLISNMLRIKDNGTSPHTYFGVVLEPKSPNAFLFNHPVLEVSKSNSKPWLLGVTRDEGSQKALMFYFNKNEKQKQSFFQNHKRILTNLFGFSHWPNASDIYEEVKKRYFDGIAIQDAFHEVGKALSIAAVHVGMLTSAITYGGTSYFFLYDYLNHPSYQRTYEVIFNVHTPEKLGVCHGEEIRSQFYQPGLYPPPTGTDQIVSTKLIDYWYNFAAYGNPNGLFSPQIWKPFTTTNFEYLEFERNGTIAPKTKLFWDEYQFFEKLNKPQMMTPQLYYQEVKRKD